jgi:hypothetical protein
MLQFMLDTSLSDAEKFPLKFQDLIVTPLGEECAERYAWSSDPRYCLKELSPVGLPGDRFYGPMFIDEGIVSYDETIVSVDPSGRGSDETVACVLSQANGYIFVRDMKAFKDGYSDQTLSAICSLAKRYKAGKMLIESNFGDGMVAELMKRHTSQMQVPIDIEEVRATTRKEERIIDTLEPVMNQHKLIMDPKVLDWDYKSNPDEAPEKRLEYMLMYQMSRMCREKGAVKHDDRIDALSATKQSAIRKHEEWQAMQDLFEEAPRLATDLLVLGKNFRGVKPANLPVYDWVSSQR